MIHYFQYKYPRKNLSRDELIINHNEYILVKQCKHHKVLKFYFKKEKCYKYFNLTNYAITGVYAWGYFLYRCLHDDKLPDKCRYKAILQTYKNMKCIDRYGYSTKEKRIIGIEYTEHYKKEEKNK